MENSPQDILMTLRPSRSSRMESCMSNRACKFLSATLLGWETNLEGTLHTLYIFNIDYCMRRSIVRKRFSEFHAFQEAMLKELPVFPGSLDKDWTHNLLLGDKNSRGFAMANFVSRAHRILADRGLFSPRLLEFLGIDSIKVHREEEISISQILDSPSLTAGSAWHIVDESWLASWRQFVVGQHGEPPPGPITNHNLLEFIPQPRHAKDIGRNQWLYFSSLQCFHEDNYGKLTLKVSNRTCDTMKGMNCVKHNIL
jgi:hypothetical protein